jgi:hypothetical protein
MSHINKQLSSLTLEFPSAVAHKRHRIRFSVIGWLPHLQPTFGRKFEELLMLGHGYGPQRLFQGIRFPLRLSNGAYTLMD